MTTPDQIRRFLKKRPMGAGRLTVAVETPLGIGHSVAEYSLEQLNAALEPESPIDPVVAIMEACQEYADSDGNDQRFSVRWFGGHDRVLGTMVHKCRAQHDADGIGPSAADLNAPGSPLAAMLIANREQQQLIGTLMSRQNAAMPQLCQSYERCIALLTAQLQASIQRETALAERVRTLESGVGQPRELTAEEREEALRRGDAWRELAALLKGRLGEAMDLAIAAGAQRLLPPAAGETRQ